MLHTGQWEFRLYMVVQICTITSCARPWSKPLQLDVIVTSAWIKSNNVCSITLSAVCNIDWIKDTVKSHTNQPCLDYFCFRKQVDRLTPLETDWQSSCIQSAISSSLLALSSSGGRSVRMTWKECGRSVLLERRQPPQCSPLTGNKKEMQRNIACWMVLNQYEFPSIHQFHSNHGVRWSLPHGDWHHRCTITFLCIQAQDPTAAKVRGQSFILTRELCHYTQGLDKITRTPHKPVCFCPNQAFCPQQEHLKLSVFIRQLVQSILVWWHVRFSTASRGAFSVFFKKMIHK